MILHKLKFTDEAAALDYLSANFPSEESNYAPRNPAEVIVLVGKIPTVQAIFDETGEEITPAIFADGWHVDILTGALPNGDYTLANPATPYHGIAGYEN